MEEDEEEIKIRTRTAASVLAVGKKKAKKKSIWISPPPLSGKSYVFLNQPPLTDELKKTKVV